ncbi:hypothetical protein K2W90_03220 [Candidatus Babeliales bacterium]|nr:hypothetical protein [Candidatus Babeliales bacterium]
MKKIYYTLLMLSFFASSAHPAASSQENTSSAQTRLERRAAIKASLHHPNRKLRQDLNLRAILGHKAVDRITKIVDNEKMIIILGHKRKIYRSQIRKCRHQEKQLADKIEKLEQKISELGKEKSSSKSTNKREIQNLAARIHIKNNQAYNLSIDKMTLKSTLAYINNKLSNLIAERSSYQANPVIQQAVEKARQEFEESRIIGHELRCIYFDKLTKAKRTELAELLEEKSPFGMASYEHQRQSLLKINQQLCQLCVSRQAYAHYPNLQALKAKARLVAQELEHQARNMYSRLATTSIFLTWDDNDQEDSKQEERMKKNIEHRIMKDYLNLLEKAVKEYMFE